MATTSGMAEPATDAPKRRKVPEDGLNTVRIDEYPVVLSKRYAAPPPASDGAPTTTSSPTTEGASPKSTSVGGGSSVAVSLKKRPAGVKGTEIVFCTLIGRRLSEFSQPASSATRLVPKTCSTLFGVVSLL